MNIREKFSIDDFKSAYLKLNRRVCRIGFGFTNEERCCPIAAIILTHPDIREGDGLQRLSSVSGVSYDSLWDFIYGVDGYPQLNDNLKYGKEVYEALIADPRFV